MIKKGLWKQEGFEYQRVDSELLRIEKEREKKGYHSYTGHIIKKKPKRKKKKFNDKIFDEKKREEEFVGKIRSFQDIEVPEENVENFFDDNLDKEGNERSNKDPLENNDNVNNESDDIVKEDDGKFEKTSINSLVDNKDIIENVIEDDKCDHIENNNLNEENNVDVNKDNKNLKKKKKKDDDMGWMEDAGMMTLRDLKKQRKRKQELDIKEILENQDNDKNQNFKQIIYEDIEEEVAIQEKKDKSQFIIKRRTFKNKNKVISPKPLVPITEDNSNLNMIKEMNLTPIESLTQEEKSLSVMSSRQELIEQERVSIDNLDKEEDYISIDNLNKEEDYISIDNLNNEEEHISINNFSYKEESICIDNISSEEKKIEFINEMEGEIKNEDSYKQNSQVEFNTPSESENKTEIVENVELEEMNIIKEENFEIVESKKEDSINFEDSNHRHSEFENFSDTFEDENEKQEFTQQNNLIEFGEQNIGHFVIERYDEPIEIENIQGKDKVDIEQDHNKNSSNVCVDKDMFDIGSNYNVDEEIGSYNKESTEVNNQIIADENKSMRTIKSTTRRERKTFFIKEETPDHKPTKHRSKSKEKNKINEMIEKQIRMEQQISQKKRPKKKSIERKRDKEFENQFNQFEEKLQLLKKEHLTDIYIQSKQQMKENINEVEEYSNVNKLIEERSSNKLIKQDDVDDVIEQADSNTMVDNGGIDDVIEQEDVSIKSSEITSTYDKKKKVYNHLMLVAPSDEMVYDNIDALIKREKPKKKKVKQPKKIKKVKKKKEKTKKKKEEPVKARKIQRNIIDRNIHNLNEYKVKMEEKKIKKEQLEEERRLREFEGVQIVQKEKIDEDTKRKLLQRKKKSEQKHIERLGKKKYELENIYKESKNKRSSEALSINDFESRVNQIDPNARSRDSSPFVQYNDPYMGRVQYNSYAPQRKPKRSRQNMSIRSISRESNRSISKPKNSYYQIAQYRDKLKDQASSRIIRQTPVSKKSIGRSENTVQMQQEEFQKSIDWSEEGSYIESLKIKEGSLKESNPFFDEKSMSAFDEEELEKMNEVRHEPLVLNVKRVNPVKKVKEKKAIKKVQIKNESDMKNLAEQVYALKEIQVQPKRNRKKKPINWEKEAFTTLICERLK